MGRIIFILLFTCSSFAVTTKTDSLFLRNSPASSVANDSICVLWNGVISHRTKAQILSDIQALPIHSKSDSSIIADSSKKYDNRYLGLHEKSDSTKLSDSSKAIDNRYLKLHAKSDSCIIADSAKGTHHLSGGNVLGDSVNCHGTVIDKTGNVSIGTTTATSKLQVVGLPTYATNALAIAGGLTVGAFYILTGTNALQVVQ